MDYARPGEKRLHPRVWALLLISVVAGSLFLTAKLFDGSLRTYVPATVVSDRSGLVMEPGGKVRLRGIEVGRVADVVGGRQPVELELELYPDQVHYIPANAEAEIKASTAFGAKFVNLIVPSEPSTQHVAAGAVLQSRNVTTEVNTVFENLVGLLDHVDPSKLSSVLGALAEGLRGQGERIGQTITDSNAVLDALNPRMDVIQQDIRALKGAADGYGAAAPDLLAILDAASTTSATLVEQSTELDHLLLGVIGLSETGTNILAPNAGNFVRGVNVLESTTDLLHKYDPSLTCTLVGGYNFLNEFDGYETAGGNGRSAILDVGLMAGADAYRYPDHLPVVGAKGGPGGKPSCGSLPDVSKQYPLRQLIADTGFGAGNDFRVNPGIGFPGWANYFPVTRGTPEPPVIRHTAPAGPAPSPIVPPGMPPYGAPMYGPGGEPLWPGLPPAPAEQVPPPANPPPNTPAP